jgi:hypothetical protein
MREDKNMGIMITLKKPTLESYIYPPETPLSGVKREGQLYVKERGMP